MLEETGVMSLPDHFWSSFWNNCSMEFENISFERFILMCLTVAVTVHLIIYIYVHVKQTKIRFGTEILLMLLFSYMLFIIEVTILGRIPGSRGRVFDTKLLWIDPSMDQNMTNLLNIILFVPYGALCSSLMKRDGCGKRILMTGLYCFLFSLMIECTQYVTQRGYFEIDDLQANAVGGILGSSFSCICLMIERRLTNHEQKE